MQRLPAEQLVQQSSRIRRRVKRPHLRNSLLKIKSLHANDVTSGQMKRDSRGIRERRVQESVAHAPSLYYWLSIKCGIPMQESSELFQQKRLILDGKPITNEGILESQDYWERVGDLDIRVKLDNGTEVPTLHRARHRHYRMFHFTRTTNFSNEVADPRGFTHAVQKYFPASSSLNLIKAPGFSLGMSGLTIVTNDSSAVRLWDNEHLGNFGVYDMVLRDGTPSEVRDRLLQRIPELLAPHAPSPDLGLSGIGCQLTNPSGNDGAGTIRIKSNMIPRKLMKETGPFFRHRRCVQVGPFVLPSGMAPRSSRPLTVEELEVLFAFERKMKTNRLVYSLREVSGEEDVGGL